MLTETGNNNGLYKLISIMGGFSGQKKIANAIGIKEQQLSLWKKRGVVPAKHCAKLKLLSGCRVELHELNPIDFPVPDKQLLSCCHVSSNKQAA